jgi:exosome complex RNA-binding protein Rrp42 (RNase PH superfamily)
MMRSWFVLIIIGYWIILSDYHSSEPQERMLGHISKSEIDFISSGCAENIREDGRGLYDFRTISIDTNILPQCNGSCRLSIGLGTDVVCSVKVFYELICKIKYLNDVRRIIQLEVTDTSVNRPDEGILQVTVDISPSINIKLEKRKTMHYSK